MITSREGSFGNDRSGELSRGATRDATISANVRSSAVVGTAVERMRASASCAPAAQSGLAQAASRWAQPESARMLASGMPWAGTVVRTRGRGSNRGGSSRRSAAEPARAWAGHVPRACWWAVEGGVAEEQLAVLAGAAGAVSPRGFGSAPSLVLRSRGIRHNRKKMTKRPRAARYAGDFITLSLRHKEALFGEQIG